MGRIPTTAFARYESTIRTDSYSYISQIYMLVTIISLKLAPQIRILLLKNVHVRIFIFLSCEIIIPDDVLIKAK